MVWATSSAVSSWPLWKVTPWRMLKRPLAGIFRRLPGFRQHRLWRTVFRRLDDQGLAPRSSRKFCGTVGEPGRGVEAVGGLAARQAHAQGAALLRLRLGSLRQQRGREGGGDAECCCAAKKVAAVEFAGGYAVAEKLEFFGHCRSLVLLFINGRQTAGRFSAASLDAINDVILHVAARSSATSGDAFFRSTPLARSIAPRG